MVMLQKGTRKSSQFISCSMRVQLCENLWQKPEKDFQNGLKKCIITKLFV